MIELIQIQQAQQNDIINGTLTLAIEQRVRSRLRAQLDDGRTAGLFLPRGSLIRGGDILSSNDGTLVKVIAAQEKVSTLYCDESVLLARAAYHLGNRHIPLQVENGWLRYQHDHVLDEMLHLMELHVTVEMAEFEPEAGAYQQSEHSHHHSHEH